MESDRKYKKEVSTPSASYELDDGEDNEEEWREAVGDVEQPLANSCDGQFWYQIYNVTLRVPPSSRRQFSAPDSYPTLCQRPTNPLHQLTDISNALCVFINTPDSI